MFPQDIGFSVSSFALSVATKSQSKGPAEQYSDCILDIAKKVEDNLSLIIEIAEVVAERTLAGGALYIRDIYAPRERLDKIRAKGARSVWVGVPMGDDLDYQWLDVFIDPFWRFGDAVVEIPGYDVKIIPPSGVIQSMIYWMLSGEAAQICVDKGIELTINRRPW